MTVHRRPGRLALVGGIALALGLAGMAAAWAHAPGLAPVEVEIGIHYSHYQRSLVTVPAGRPRHHRPAQRRRDRSRMDRR